MVKFGREYFEYCKNSTGFNMNEVGDWQYKYFEFLLEVFGKHIKKELKLLDIGCATGLYPEVANRLGYNMFGCDVSQWYIDNSPFNNIKNKLKLIENSKMPFDDNMFDFIQMSQVIEHIPESDIYEELNDIKRVMSDDCVLYISTVGEGHELPPDGEDPTHISCFSEKKWKKIFKKCGFKNITRKYKNKIAQNELAMQYNWVNFVLIK